MKAGFVVMIGRSNVGKSTLMNTLVGSKVAITSPKPQTTRRPVRGIVSDQRGQIVFVDTPGVLSFKGNPLGHRLSEYIQDALSEIDVVLYVADVTRAPGREEGMAGKLLENVQKPKILVINKIDLGDTYVDFYKDMSSRFDAVVQVSAKTSKNLKLLLEKIFEFLPEGTPFYPEGQFTDMPFKEWVGELVREKLFLRLKQEIPYALHVEVQDIQKRKDGVLYIQANILTSLERYKPMLIGAGGRGIKEIGQSTRRELEGVLGGKVYLDLHVDVDPHWVERFY